MWALALGHFQIAEHMISIYLHGDMTRYTVVARFIIRDIITESKRSNLMTCVISALGSRSDGCEKPAIHVRI